jgi:hypothetical protein
LILVTANRDLTMLQATRGAQLPIVRVCTRLPETAFASATIHADTGAIPATLCHRQHATNDRAPVDGGSPDVMKRFLRSTTASKSFSTSTILLRLRWVEQHQSNQT